MTLVGIAGLVLLVGAVLALALPGNRSKIGASVGAQAIGTLLTVVAVLPALAGAPLSVELSWSYPAESVTLRVDALSAFFLVWSMPLTCLGSVYGSAYLRSDLDAGRNAGPHFALLAILQLSYLLVYSAQDTMVFLLGWEIAAVSAWLLVIWSYRTQKVRFAGFNYLVSTHIGLFVLAAALMTLHAGSGSFDFASFAGPLQTPGPLRDTTWLLLGVAFALKSAFFPFHTWLPRAHAAAPAHVSALMSGVIHKAGLFGFLRFTLLLGDPPEWMGWAVLAFGAASAILGALFTTTQRDLKRLLGYSSTENVGVAAMGFGIGYLGLAWSDPRLVALGFGGGLLHLLNHALFKCLLFYAAGAVYRTTHTVDLERLGGLAKAMPATAGLFLVGGLAIAALPPLNGFASEFLLYRGLFRSGATGNAAAALVLFAAALGFTGAISAFSVVRAFGTAFLGTPREHRVAHAEDPPAAMRVPMAAHAVAVVLVGLVPTAGLALAGPAVALFGDPSGIDVELGAVSGVNAVLLGCLAVPLAARWLLVRRSAAHTTWGCGYPAPTPRMQYTASSFAAPFARLFDAWMPAVVQRSLPRGFFPAGHGQFRAHHPDPIERRLFDALDQGERGVAEAYGRFASEPRVVFAAGLALILLLAFLVGGAS